MDENKNWLSDITVVSEGESYSHSSNIDIFRSLGDACRKLEPWYIKEQSFFALNGEGHPIEFNVVDGFVEAKILQNEPKDISTLTSWLADSVKYLSTVRSFKSDKGKLILGELESKGILPTSIEGLIAYHHFTK